MNHKNHEGYLDLTASKAIAESSRMPDEVKDVIYALRNVASLAGFEVKGHIRLVDKVTGKEYW